MELHPAAGQQRGAAEATPGPTTQVGRMRAAINQAVTTGPAFLRGDVDADHMANTMVHAVRNYADQERAAGGNGAPQSAEAHALQGVLAELNACGSGFLAGRCDAACVARTMTHMVHQFGPH